MDIMNSNHVRISVRFFNRRYGERFSDFHAMAYNSRDHGKPRPERTYSLAGLGVRAELKYRPDGKL